VESAVSSIEKDDWVWPNVVGDRGFDNEESGDDGDGEATNQRDLIEVEENPEAEAEAETGAENVAGGWEDIRENGAAVQVDVESDPGSDSTASTPHAASVSSDPLALDTDRPPTPPTSSISQITFPEAPGQRTPRAESTHDEVELQATTAPSVGNQQASQRLQIIDWTRLLVEDRAWLVVLLTLYMLANQ
jgi:hypothetical protein